MQVLLQISSSKTNVRNVRLKSDTVIGRSPECQLKVASNQISRRHCQIVIRDNLVAIKDLGSANGTFVNGRQIPAEVEIPLTPGTRVMLGPLQFTVEYDLPGMSPAKGMKSVASAPAAAPVTPAQVVDEPNYDTISAPLPPMPVAMQPAQPVVPIATLVAQSPPAEPAETEGIPDFATTPEASPATVIAESPFGNLPAEAFTPGQAGDDEVDPGSFNFGIFASSGSGIIVESSEEIPVPSGLGDPAPKPAKKGLLAMLGWGKKKDTSPTPEPPAKDAPDETAPAIQPDPDPEHFVDPGETLSFSLPDDLESDPSSSDDALPNLFNFK